MNQTEKVTVSPHASAAVENIAPRKNAATRSMTSSGRRVANRISTKDKHRPKSGRGVMFGWIGCQGCPVPRRRTTKVQSSGVTYAAVIPPSTIRDVPVM